MGTKINKLEFKKEFGEKYKTATIAREMGYTPNTLYAVMNPNSKQTIGKEKVNFLKEKYNLSNPNFFYESSC